ncbi:DEAD/DEAH box helicase [archaeon]|nr:DEAD/DEAH box helicase [archaeon]
MKELQNIKPRKYQEEIAKTCIEKNCLVVLPTGLGKTLIALMVVIERIKKFPKEKVLILAPTKPLAEQHLISFKEKLPELWAEIELFTGTVKAEKRKKIWDTANIIFSTPQCVANDLKKGLYTLKEVSLLIEDEAHRCVKNYDYTYVAKRYYLEANHPRLIGLTASPGSDLQKIREIGMNLKIESIEIRTRDSDDVKEYLQELEFDKREIPFPEELIELRAILKQIYESYIDELRRRNFLFGPDTKIALIELQRKIGFQLSKNIASPESYIAMSACAQAIKISHAIELLETQTLESFMKYLRSIQEQAEKKQSRGVIKLANKKEFNLVYSYTYSLLEKGKEHPKVEEIIRAVRDEIKEDSEMKMIIFTQFRDTANIISRNLNKLGGINSKVFVGQRKLEGVGLSQKEQKKIIDEFREKKINVLVATCIAEEGLDIPEVSSVIFYEPVSSAIRSIQRRGRTARLSKGKLIMLITKGTKDEFANYASRAREKKMGTQIEKVKDELKRKGTLYDKKIIQKKLF